MSPAAALLAGSLLLAPVSPSTATNPTVCDRFGDGVVAGTVEADGFTEISGVVASRRHEGVLWVHDDSDGAPELAAVGSRGEDLGTYTVADAEARDWEDIAAHDGHLYVGDIGDNRSTWPSVTVYRVPEPESPPDGTGGALRAETIGLVHPDGPANAEALLVDPRSGDLVVLTKEDGRSRVLEAPAATLLAGTTVPLEPAGGFAVPPAASRTFGLPGTLVTGADVSPDGSVVLVRTYRSILAFHRPAGSPLSAAFEQPPCEVPQVEELQGEAVAFLPGGDAYVTIAEGPHPAVHRFEARTTDPAPPVTGTDEGEGGDVDRFGGVEPVVVAALLLALLLGAVLVAPAIRRARRSP